MAQGIKLSLVGQQFGRLTVESEFPHKGRSWWNCYCNPDFKGCGTRLVVCGTSLVRGTTQSCGCLMIERGREANTIHGLWHSPTQNSYHCMLSRCLDPKDKFFHRYGGLGITICDRWLGPNGFKNFVEDMGIAPSGMTIDRYPVRTGNYEPSNCRWATQLQQQRGRSNNHYVTIGEETYCLSEWCERLGLGRDLVNTRINKQGWDPVAALTTPKSQGKRGLGKKK